MTASEFAFLSLGLVLGVLSGAALVEVLRSRPPAAREVRLTVTPHSIPPRRSTTLSEDAFTTPGAGPGDALPAAPAATRLADRPTDSGAQPRTAVRSSLPPGGAGGPGSSLPLSRAVARPVGPPSGGSASFSLAVGAGTAGGAMAVPIHMEPDWTLQALRAAAARVAEVAIRDQRLSLAAVLERSVAASPTARAAQPGGARDAEAAPASNATPSTSPDQGVADTNGSSGGSPDCADAARVANERCAVATRAREQAETAHGALRAAQRAYDDHEARAETGAAASDPRAIRAAKETAQQAFRDARSRAATPDAVEAAAREWLTEINRINRSSREAAAAVAREREGANGLAATIERLTVQADAARIAAEGAAEACIAARQAVADCQEAATSRAATPADAAALPAAGARSGPWEDESELEAAFSATGVSEPAILRLLRGDRAAVGRIVQQLGGEDTEERRRWQLTIAELVDGVIARAIEASALTFPLEHPFWGASSLAQNRDIVAALSSLGFRFDGLGGWADGRVPTQRDLSLAVGYAGLDPMRTRRWPAEAEIAELFRDVAVAADEYLAGAAGGLTLGELVSLLGRRADGLADLWNSWGRVRPLLLAGG